MPLSFALRKFSSFSGVSSVTVQDYAKLGSLVSCTKADLMLKIQSAKKGRQQSRYMSQVMIEDGPPIKLLTNTAIIAEIMNYHQQKQRVSE